MKNKTNHTRMKKLSKFNHNLTPMLLDRIQITHERTSIVPNQKKKKKIQYNFFLANYINAISYV